MINLAVQADRTLIRAAERSARYVLVSFAAPPSPRAAARAEVNIALVIDRSGSMGGRKIELARAAVVQALQMLRSGDRFALIGYDHQVDIIVPSTPATPEAVRNAIDRVNALQARGNTDLGGGWLRGCEQIAQQLRSEEIGKCLLVTDGLANYGITDPGELARHAEALRERGVRTSTFGIGNDFDEQLLTAMAQAGAGHSYFIETPVQIPDFLTSELGETLDVVARDVAIVARAADAVSVTTLNSFPIQPLSDGGVAVRLGDVVSRQELSVVFKLKFPTGAEGSTTTAVFCARDEAAALRATEADVVWTYRDHAANDAQPRDIAVDRAVAHLYAAKARTEALELNRAGRFDEAQKRLEATARRIAQYAGNDPELLEIIAGLTERHVMYRRAMSPLERKAEHYASLHVAQMRTEDGRARRR